jgi:hypothetical protein
MLPIALCEVPLAPASAAARAAYGLLSERRDKKPCKFHQFSWANRERVLYKEW